MSYTPETDALMVPKVLDTLTDAIMAIQIVTQHARKLELERDELKKINKIFEDLLNEAKDKILKQEEELNQIKIIANKATKE